MHYRLNRSFGPWLLFHTLEYWYYYIGAIASLYFLHHFSSEIPELAKDLGDMAMSGKLQDIPISEFFLLALYILFFRTMSRLLFFYPARVQQRNLRMELVERIENALPRKYKKYSEGHLFQTLWNDLNRIRGFVGFALLQFGNIIIATMIFIPKIEAFNGDFLIAFSPLLVCVVVFSIIIYFFHPYQKRSMNEYAEVQKFLIECYDAKKTIQNYHSEKDFYKVFSDISNKELRTFFISSMGRVLSFPMIKIGVAISLVWAALIVKDNGLAASDLIFFSSFLFLILEPLMFLSWIGIVASQGFAAWTRIKELTSDLEERVKEEFYIREQDVNNPVVPLWDKDCTIHLKPASWMVLVGETGVGKSWILERISEVLDVNKKRYSLIHQEPYLYNDTIEKNLFLGLDITEEKREKAKHYLKEFGLDILGRDLDQVLKMEIGENGKRVSGGQAKRIALIRSIVSEAEFILWDDPFSSVDLILESQIIQNIKKDPDLRHKTFIVTSHRLSTVRSCDYIYYISKENGLEEQGEKEKLLNSGSLVDAFFKKQLV